MSQNTSSPKNYNIMALRGAQISDQEYVETFGLDPALANTPALNDAMLKMTYDQNISAGVDPETADKNMKSAASGIKKLLAQNGMLK